MPLSASSARRLRALAAWPGWARTAWMRGSNARGVPLSASSDIAPATSASRAASSASRSASAPSAVMHCVPLIRRGPPWPRTATGARPACASASPPGSRSPSRNASPSPISTSARCASGARSPDAPTDPLRGDDRVDAAVEHLAQEVAHHGAHARVAEREHLRAQEHHRAHHRLRQGRADAGGVRADEVALEVADLVGADAHVGEHAEAGVDAVDRRRGVATVGDASTTRRAASMRARASVPSCTFLPARATCAMASSVSGSAPRLCMRAVGSRALTRRQERQIRLIVGGELI